MSAPPAEMACAATEIIECDNCGDKTRAWDYAPDYSRFCLECLAGLEDDDPRADRGCFEYHSGRE